VFLTLIVSSVKFNVWRFLVHIHVTPKLEDAIVLLEGTSSDCLISLVPEDELMRRAARITAGAFDFDGTLTTGSQWRAIDDLMPEVLRELGSQNRDWYWSHLHKIGNLPASVLDPDWFHSDLHEGNQKVAEGAWIAETISLYRQAGLTRRDIEDVWLALPQREGACDLLELVDPRVVISFGVEQVILSWLQNLQVVDTAVAASRLKFNEEGVVSGCHINLVVSETKQFAADRFRQITGVAEDQLLVVGDSVVDVHMMHPRGFNILIVPRAEADKKLAGFRTNGIGVMWDRLTAILVSDSLQPLVELIERARATHAT